MNIRQAQLPDFGQLYELGKNTPELAVSSSGNFMEPDEFKWAITNPAGIFLLAEDDNKPVAFIYANKKDSDRPYHRDRWACIVYLTVSKDYRKRGIAQSLYNACEQQLKAAGITKLYAWANAEGDGAIIKFNKKQGFAEGHKYVWMDKNL